MTIKITDQYNTTKTWFIAYNADKNLWDVTQKVGSEVKGSDSLNEEFLLAMLDNLPKERLDLERVVTVCKAIARAEKTVDQCNARITEINETPNYWNGFYGGMVPTPTARCESLLNTWEANLAQAEKAVELLMSQITYQEACSSELICTDGLDAECFA